MNIRESKPEEKVQWNVFVDRGVGGSFLQTFEWGEFMATQKDKIFRLIVEEEGDWLATIFFFKSKLKMNQAILYAPRGPVFSPKGKVQPLKQKIFELMMERIEEIAAEEGCLMFQIDPLSSNNEWCTIFDQMGFVKSDANVQPRHTLILNLQKSADQLLKEMHPKTRYNINLAQKKELVIEVDNTKVEKFMDLLRKTEERQQINMFGETYFEEILKLPFAHLYLAKIDWQYVAANIMIFCGDTATYLFGATDYESRALRAPFLLQWQAIQDAVKANFKFYDFWGAAPPGATGQEARWSGFTQFKMGFSPKTELTEYIGTYEKQFQPVKLGVYRFLQKVIKR